MTPDQIRELAHRIELAIDDDHACYMLREFDGADKLATELASETLGHRIAVKLREVATQCQPAATPPPIVIKDGSIASMIEVADDSEDMRAWYDSHEDFNTWLESQGGPKDGGKR